MKNLKKLKDLKLKDYVKFIRYDLFADEFNEGKRSFLSLNFV